jgi:GNAT superfamily N-acetyltransferase
MEKSCEIRRVPVCDVFADPRFDELTRRYWDECHIDALGAPNGQLSIYQAMEAAGVLTVLCAYDDAERLIGGVFLTVYVVPHYGTRVGSAESIFVDPAYRKSGAGLKLIRAATALAKERGARGMYFSAPTGSRLADVLPRVGFRETNRVFFKGFV